MKKHSIALVAFMVVLSGCNQKPTVSETVIPEGEKVVDTGSGDYQTIVPQPTSEVRGVANNSIDSTLDLDAMETGLMDIAKEHADVKKYIYQPGTIISADEASALIKREYTSDQFADVVKADPTKESIGNIGLDQPLKDGEDPAEKPKYVNTIIEQDYFTYKTEKDGSQTKQIDKIAIGFGMDPSYTYTDSKGVEKTITIKDSELKDYADSYVANKMTKFIRGIQDSDGNYPYKDTEIIYGFFKESNNDMYPGTYYSSGFVKKGEDNMSDTKDINQKYVLFPTDEGKAQNESINTQITKLEQEVRGYFPYNTGTYASGYYENNKLQKIYIRLTVDVYSRVDLIPFVNFVEDTSKDLLNEGVNTVIDIRKSSGEAEGILLIDPTGKIEKHIY